MSVPDVPTAENQANAANGARDSAAAARQSAREAADKAEADAQSAKHAADAQKTAADNRAAAANDPNSPLNSQADQAHKDLVNNPKPTAADKQRVIDADRAAQDERDAAAKDVAAAQQAEKDAQSQRERADQLARQEQIAAAEQARTEAASTAAAATLAAAQSAAQARQLEQMLADAKSSAPGAAALAHKAKGDPVAGLELFTLLDWTNKCDGDWFETVLGKKEVKISGWERKLVVGSSDTLYVSPKHEFLFGAKFTRIQGVETKVVLGLAYTRVLGMKKDVVLGAALSNLLGAKIESHLGPKVELGNGKHTKTQPVHQEKAADAKIDARVAKYDIPKQSVKATNITLDVKSMEERVSKLRKKIDSALQKADSVVAQVQQLTIESERVQARSTGTLDLIASSALKITSSANTFELNSTHAQIKRGGQSIECVGGQTTIRGSSVKWD